MTYDLTIDFLGMAVVIESSNQVSVGLLKEPGHVHTINYFREKELPAISALDLRCKGAQTISTTDSPAKTILEANKRLLDISPLGVAHHTRQTLQSLFSTIFEFSGGRLDVLPAHVGDDVSTWKMGSQGTFNLSDRMRFTGKVSSDRLQLGGIELRARKGEIYAAISSIDRDYGTREEKIREGFPLTEFALFYRVTANYGEIPAASPVGFPANPDTSVCPLGYIRI